MVNLSQPDVALGLDSDRVSGPDLEGCVLEHVVLDFVAVAESETAAAVEQLYGWLLHCWWTFFLAA